MIYVLNLLHVIFQLASMAPAVFLTLFITWWILKEIGLIKKRPSNIFNKLRGWSDNISYSNIIMGSVCLALLFVLTLFGFLHPLVLIWIGSLGTFFVLKFLTPKEWELGQDKVTNRFWIIPLFVGILLSIVYFIYRILAFVWRTVLGWFNGLNLSNLISQWGTIISILILVTISLLIYKWLRRRPDQQNQQAQQASQDSFFRPLFKLALTLALLTGFVWACFYGYRFYYPNTATQQITRVSIERVQPSVDTILQTIGSCESPGEPGGKQFTEDKDGNRVVVTGDKDPDDTGALQINKRIHADLIKKTGIDPAKSKEDNYRLGRILYERDGTAPWSASEYCWGPKIGLTVRSEYKTELEAPIDKPSRELETPLGYTAGWGESEDSFSVHDDRGNIALYDRKNGIIENIPPGAIRLHFKSLSPDKPAQVKLTYKKIISTRVTSE